MSNVISISDRFKIKFVIGLSREKLLRDSNDSSDAYTDDLGHVKLFDDRNIAENEKEVNEFIYEVVQDERNGLRLRQS